MPAPNAEMLSKLAKCNFISKRINLPIDWSEPGSQFPDAFKEKERTTTPNSPLTLFKESSLNKYHVETAKEISDLISEYIEGVTRAVCKGIDFWMKMAIVAGVSINGPIGLILPGCIAGPLISPVIFAKAPKKSAQETKYSSAIANAIGKSWQSWHIGLTGVLSYPLFALSPSPIAPPTPNVPLPLIALTSVGEIELSPKILKQSMETNFADPKSLHSSDIFDAVSKSVNTVFQTFKMTTVIQGVMGTGPVPSFPAGPVIGGTVIPKPNVII